MTMSRRTVLRGLGTTLALPLLDAMLPLTAFGAPNPKAAPNRMAVFYVPNGMHMPDWSPAQVGRGFELPPILAKLAPFKDDLLVLSGLAHDKANANGDGGGDHARALSVFLTGCQPKKTHGADIKVGMSADQVAAQQVGLHTKFASLELGIDRGANAGNCDSGYSCAYSTNTSWRTESTPMSKEVNPRLVFERLFNLGDTQESAESRARRERYKKSILDFVQEDANRLRVRLGTTDQRKMDEYLASIRELEQRIVRAERHSAEITPPSNFARPDGIPKEYAQHIRLMADLMVLALQGDPFIEVQEGHHDLSHHGNDKAKQAKISKINQFHIAQFGYFLEKAKATPEAGGTLLDHSMIVYGSAIGDGNAHNHDDLPILVAGRGCGTLTPGRHVRYERNTPLMNFWLSLLDRMGASADRLGDSTGRVNQLHEA